MPYFQLVRGTLCAFCWKPGNMQYMGLLPDTLNCGLRMHLEWRKRFVRHRGLAISTCITTRGTCVTHLPWCVPESLINGVLWTRWRGKRSRHSRRLRNPQFCVSGKRPIAKTTHVDNTHEHAHAHAHAHIFAMGSSFLGMLLITWSLVQVMAEQAAKFHHALHFFMISSIKKFNYFCAVGLQNSTTFKPDLCCRTTVAYLGHGEKTNYSANPPGRNTNPPGRNSQSARGE